MKKSKMLLASLIAVVSIGISVPPTFAQGVESESTNEITINSSSIFYSKEYPKTTEQVKWVSVARNGKIYSGNIYNRGSLYNEFYHYFSGTLLAGPYMPTNAIQEK